MKLSSVLRTPYRSRGLVRTGVAGGMDEASLDFGVLATELVLLALSAARVCADLRNGLRTIEGSLALVLVVTMAACLGGRVIAWATRRPSGGRRLPPASPPSVAFRSKDAHAR
jgi:hypothetical protein